MMGILIAVGLFAAVVWVMANAIFMLVRRDADIEVSRGRDDPISTFIQENYASRSEAEDRFSEENLRKL